PEPPPAARSRSRSRVRRDPTGARRSAPSRARVWRERSYLPLAACAIVAPLLMGGAFGWSVIATACLAAAACGAVWVGYRRELGSIPAPASLVVAAGALAFTCLQALPLPRLLVHALAPASAQAVELTAHAAGTPVAWFCALTRDPGGTETEIVKGAA